MRTRVFRLPGDEDDTQPTVVDDDTQPTVVDSSDAEDQDTQPATDLQIAETLAQRPSTSPRVWPRS